MVQFIKCKICKGEDNLVNKKYNLGKCTNCKFIFCLSIFAKDEFTRIYDE